MSRRDEFGFGLQADMETAATVFPFSPPITEGNLLPDREELDIEETMGTRAPGPQEYGGYIFDGDIEFALRPNSIGGLFSMFWGEPTSAQPDAATSPTIWEHEWDPLVADPVFGTVITKANDPDPKIVNKFIGCLGNELTLSVEANDYLLGEGNLLARQLVPDPNPEPSLTREALPKWVFTDVSILLGVPSVNGGVPQVIKCKEWELEYSNDLVNDEFILGTPLVDSIPLGDIELNAMFRPTRDIHGHNRRALATTPELISLTLRAVGRLIGATTHRYTLEIELGALETVDADVELNGGETLRDVEVNCRAILNETTGKLLTATVKNAYNGAGYQAPA